MTFVFAAVFILLLIVSPVAALVFAVLLLIFSIATPMVRRRLHASKVSQAATAGAHPDHLVAGDLEHRMAAIGGVPRGER